MSDRDPDFIDSDGPDPEQVADEQFVHGLLESARRDDEQARRQRLARVMAAVGGDATHLTTPRPSRWRRAVMPLTMAAAVTVVVTLLVTGGPRSAADVVACLRAAEVGDAKVSYTAAGVQSKVVGQLDLGPAGARLLAVKASPESGCLLLRTRDGDCTARLHEKFKRPEDLVSWPQWLQVDKLVTPLRTPAEWLETLTRSHSFAFEESSDRQRIIGSRRAGIRDALVPLRCELVLDGRSKRLRTLRLFWSPTVIEDGGRRQGAGQALDYFDELDKNDDGKVTRTEAGAEWERLSSMGFPDDRLVTREEFRDAVSPRLGPETLELLSRRPDLEQSQPPRELILSIGQVEGRPAWLFDLEVFRHR